MRLPSIITAGCQVFDIGQGRFLIDCLTEARLLSGIRLRGAAGRTTCTAWRHPAIFTTATPKPKVSLPFNVDQLRQYFITGCNDPGIGLKGPLGGYHLDKFLGQINIRHLQRAGTDITQPAVSGYSGQRLSRRQRFLIQILTHFG